MSAFARRLAAAVLCAAAGASLAQGVDPTRPQEPRPQQPGAAEQAPAPSAEVQLQAVLIAPGRRAAILNGTVVEQGATYEGARLVAVREDAVVLRTAEGSRTVKLHPEIDKRAIPAAKAPAKPRPRPRTATPKTNDHKGGTAR